MAPVPTRRGRCSFGGSALHQAALALCEQARGFAAAALRVDEREVMLDWSTGRWRAGNDATSGLAWSDLAALHPGLSADGKYDSAPTVPFGAHLALVEVDIDTGAIGAPPAVQNAVIDALAHLGVRHIDMPLTPSKVWNAIRNSRPARTPSRIQNGRANDHTPV